MSQMTNKIDVHSLLSHLIQFRSLTGEERGALHFLEQRFGEWNWNFERIPVSADRWNLFVSFGSPEILYTTHVDVVPAPDSAFSPRQENDRIIGRGACDAKGPLVAMIAALHRLRSSGADNLALLVVVGEEVDGIGARVSADALQGRGIRYLINGEPTEGKLMSAHRGYIHVRLRFQGKACHSGYPHLGVDANRALVETLSRVYAHHWPVHPEFGETLVNAGVIRGGSALNIISPRAETELVFRSTCSSAEVLRELEQVVAGAAEVEVLYAGEPIRCHVLPGFDYEVASFSTDIPGFAPLGATPLLYGPGSIHHAHTDGEFLLLADLDGAISGYEKLYHEIRRAESGAQC